MNALCNRALSILYEATQVDAGSIYINEPCEEPLFVLDHWSARPDSEIRQLGNRNLGTIGSGDHDATQFRKVVAQAAGVAHVDRVSFSALDCCGDLCAAHGRFDDLVDLRNAEVVASRCLAPNLIVDVVPACDPLEEGASCSLNSLKRLL